MRKEEKRMQKIMGKDERYKDDGYGRSLWTADAVLQEAHEWKLPLKRVKSSGAPIVEAYAEGGCHTGLPEKVDILADRDGFITGWKRGGVACVADHVRLRIIDSGYARFAFYRNGIITGYATVPRGRRVKELSLLASARRVLPWLSECGIVPSVSIHGESLTIRLRTVSGPFASISFVRMGSDYVMDSFAIAGEKGKAYGIDMLLSSWEGWGARVYLKTRHEDGSDDCRILKVGIPGTEEWLDEEMADMLS